MHEGLKTAGMKKVIFHFFEAMLPCVFQERLHAFPVGYFMAFTRI